MKKNSILLCTLLCLCLCFAACERQSSPEPSDSHSAGNANITSDTPENEIPSEDKNMAKPTQTSLHVSEVPYALPSGSDPNSGGVNEDLLIYHEEADNCIILFDILGSDIVVDYGENIYKHMDMKDIIQTPGLYHMIEYFDVSLEDLLEAANTGFYGPQYDEDILRAMFSPYEDMLEATMNPKGAYLDGNVHNIQTLNELFENDKDAFARIKLDELIAYQERLEENGIDYGFNEDMVEFANQNCAVATSLAFLDNNYSVNIPGSVTVNAAVYDQYGNKMTGETITYTLQSAYTGVSIDSATGEVTVQSSAMAGTVNIQANYGSLMVADVSLILSKTTPVATTIAFTQESYSTEIPTSGSTAITVTAQVMDQNGNVISGISPTYSITPAYAGATIDSTTGVVTIQSTTTAGTVNVHAQYGTLTAASVNLTLYNNIKAALNAVINEALALLEDDYTTDSWAIFAEALVAAQNVAADEEATQAQVNIALSALVSAMENLSTANNLRLITDADVVTNGDYFTVTPFFKTAVRSNTATLDFTLNKEKFEFTNFYPANGVILLTQKETENGVRFIVMVASNSIASLGEVQFFVKKNAVLLNEENVIRLSVNYIETLDGGMKVQKNEVASAIITTANSGSENDVTQNPYDLYYDEENE